MDIDMLGLTSNEDTNIIGQIRDIMAVNVEPDGLRFDPESVQSEKIAENADYRGLESGFVDFWTLSA